MPSYRYLRDIHPEDLAPETAPELSGREKAKNWWHYHWIIVLVAAALAAFVIYFVYVVFIRKVPQPDYQIAVVGATLTEDQVEALERRLAAFVPDSNQDGEVIVQINNYDVDFSEAGLAAMDQNLGSEAASAAAFSAAEVSSGYVDVYGQMAADVRLTADFQDCLSGIFIVCDPAGFERSTAAFRYLDGTPSETDEDGYGPNDWYNMVYPVSGCPVLVSALDAEAENAADEDDIGNLLKEHFYIGFRSAFEEDDALALADDDALFAALTAGAVPAAAEETP